MALPTMGLAPLAAVLGTFATGGSRELALRFGIVRQPDPFVPQHTRPVAALGGLALAAAAAAALALDAGGSSISGAMIVGALLFLAVGLLDDVHGLSPAWKLALQILAATISVALGLTLPISGNGLIDAMAAVVWIVVLVNAVNLTDVCDGLVTGLSIIALLALGAIEPALWAPCLAVAGACLGILVYNSPPASIFLGDAGSHFLGFALAALSLAAVREANATNRLVAGALIVGVPLFELVFVVLARTGRREPWWRASADHFSLRLQAAGLSRWQTDAVAWTAAVLLALAGWSFVRLSLAGRFSLLLLVLVALATSWRLLLHWDPEPARRPSR